MAYSFTVHGGYGAKVSVTERDSVGASDHPVLVHDTELLFTAHFHRAGPDLVLQGHDGRQLLIQGYFSSEHHPALLAPNGARLTPDLLVRSSMPGHYVQAAPTAPPEAIGKIEKAFGDVAVMRNGVAVTLHVGDAVFKSDVVQTGSQSGVGIGFPDGTALNLTANTRMALNEYSFDANGASNGALFSLVEGTFQFVAGKVAHSGDMKIATPIATMGIRGTTGFVEEHVGAITSNQGNVHYYSYGLVNDYDANTHRVSDSHGFYDIEVLNPDGTTTQFTVADTKIEWDVIPGAPGQPAQILAVPLSAARLSDLDRTFQDFFSAHFQATQQQTNGGNGSSTLPPDLQFNQAPQLGPVNPENPTNKPAGGPSGGPSGGPNSDPNPNPINPPTADPNSIHVNENNTHTFQLADFKFTGNDTADTLTSVTITSLPTDGTLWDGNHQIIAADLAGGGFVVSAADIAAGKLVFVPASNDVNPSSFNFRVTDSESNITSANAAAMNISIIGDTLSATGVSIGAIEGNAVTATVATFTDGNPSATTADFTATINWGDGTSSAGTITETNGVFSVAGTHTYREEGSDPISVTIKDVDGSTATASSTATVADAPLSATGGVSVGATEGNPFTATVATF